MEGNQEHGALLGSGAGATGCLENSDSLQVGTMVLITWMSGDKCSKESINGVLKPQEISYYPDSTLEKHLPYKRVHSLQGTFKYPAC